MDLLPDAQQEAIAWSARSLIEQYDAPARLNMQPPADSMLDDRFWKQAAEQGFFSLGLPEEYGGAGLGTAEETLLFREIGRGLVPGPFLGTVLAAHVAARAGDSRLAQRFAEGETAGVAERDSSGLLRTQDAFEPAWWLVLDEHDTALLPTDAVAVTTTKPAVDPAVRLAELEITGVPTHTVVRKEYDAHAHAGVLVAAMLSGICEATRDQSRDYVCTRQQFGAQLGSFQSVKHRCADMAMLAESLTGLVHLAALFLDEGTTDADLLWASARALAGSYAIASVGDNIQNHGAIGFTAELHAHLYQKRAHSLTQLLSTAFELRHAVLDAAPSRSDAKETH